MLLVVKFRLLSGVLVSRICFECVFVENVSWLIGLDVLVERLIVFVNCLLILDRLLRFVVMLLERFFGL